MREVAGKLGVAHILEGTVQKLADQVRVNVQLINATSDAHLWAETYDRKLTDVFAIETEIARVIAGKLRAKVTGREEAAISSQPTENSEAHQLYLKGIEYFWNKRTSDGLKNLLAILTRQSRKIRFTGPPTPVWPTRIRSFLTTVRLWERRPIPRLKLHLSKP